MTQGRRTRSAASSYLVDEDENQPVEEATFFWALERRSTAEGAIVVEEGSVDGRVRETAEAEAELEGRWAGDGAIDGALSMPDR